MKSRCASRLFVLLVIPAVSWLIAGAAADASSKASRELKSGAAEMGFLRLVADSAESAFVVRNAARLSASDLLSLTSEAQRASTAAPDPLEETGVALRTGDVVQTRAGAGNTALVWQSARHSAPMCRIILGGSSEMQLGPAIRGRPELRLNSGTALVDCTADGRDLAAAGNGESSTRGKIGNEAIMLSGLGGTLVMWSGSQAAFRYIYEGGEVPLLAAFSGSSVFFPEGSGQSSLGSARDHDNSRGIAVPPGTVLRTESGSDRAIQETLSQLGMFLQGTSLLSARADVLARETDEPGDVKAARPSAQQALAGPETPGDWPAVWTRDWAHLSPAIALAGANERLMTAGDLHPLEELFLRHKVAEISALYLQTGAAEQQWDRASRLAQVQNNAGSASTSGPEQADSWQQIVPELDRIEHRVRLHDWSGARALLDQWKRRPELSPAHERRLLYVEGLVFQNTGDPSKAERRFRALQFQLPSGVSRDLARDVRSALSESQMKRGGGVVIPVMLMQDWNASGKQRDPFPFSDPFVSMGAGVSGSVRILGSHERETSEENDGAPGWGLNLGVDVFGRVPLAKSYAERLQMAARLGLIEEPPNWSQMALEQVVVITRSGDASPSTRGDALAGVWQKSWGLRAQVGYRFAASESKDNATGTSGTQGGGALAALRLDTPLWQPDASGDVAAPGWSGALSAAAQVAVCAEDDAKCAVLPELDTSVFELALRQTLGWTPRLETGLEFSADLAVVPVTESELPAWGALLSTSYWLTAELLVQVSGQYRREKVLGAEVARPGASLAAFALF